MKNRTIAVLACMLLLTGCTSLFLRGAQRHEHNASSLVDFLYPQGTMPPSHNAVPVLQLPLRVGIAFLPPGPNSRNVLGEVHKQAMLERIRQRFVTRPFVGDITLIPDYYLTVQRGFKGLEAIQRLYDVDLVALVSYDQVAHQDDNEWSLGYLTIVGAYVIKGTRQDVSTLMDLAVVHPATGSLVLRAGGVDSRHNSSSLVRADRERRATGVAGFDAAAGRLIENFDAALVRFEEDVRTGTARVQVASSSGVSGGGGAFDWVMIAVLGACILSRKQVSSASILPGPCSRRAPPRG